MKISIMGICMEDALRKGMPVEDFLTACKKLGADGVELASRHLPMGPNGLRRVRGAADSLGLKVSSYNISTDLVGTEPEAWERRTRDIADGLATAEELGSAILMVGASPPPNMPPADIRRLIADHLAEAVEPLEGAEIKVTMENRGAALADICGRAADIKWLCETVGSRRFGWTFDTGNFIMADDDPVAALETLMPFVAHVHVKDTRHVPKDKMNPYHEVCIGKGQTDVRAMLAKLKGAGFDGFLSLEVTTGEKRKADLRESIRYIRGIWGG
ncbi:MAG: sugar phosphate isomerase/epimerase family protein [Planctomycetota bacterium]